MCSMHDFSILDVRGKDHDDPEKVGDTLSHHDVSKNEIWDYYHK